MGRDAPHVLYKAAASRLQQWGAHSSPQCLPGSGAKPLSAEGLWLTRKGSHRHQPQLSTARGRRAGEHPSCAQRPAAHSLGPCTSSAASSSPGTCQGAVGHLQRREYCKLLVSVSHPKGRNISDSPAQPKLNSAFSFPVPPSFAG